MITRALGLSGDPEVTEIELRSGDTFLLCTDGLSEEVSEARMAALLAGADIDTACQVMVREAYAAGGRDNITAVVVQCR
jgi:serine/threonine protein phosphatase PrpC